MPENREAGEIYFIVRNQFVTAEMGQPIDINVLAVFKAMDEYPHNIENRWECFMKIRRAFFKFLPKTEKQSDF